MLTNEENLLADVIEVVRRKIETCEFSERVAWWKVFAFLVDARDAIEQCAATRKDAAFLRPPQAGQRSLTPSADVASEVVRAKISDVAEPGEPAA